MKKFAACNFSLEKWGQTPEITLLFLPIPKPRGFHWVTLAYCGVKYIDKHCITALGLDGIHTIPAVFSNLIKSQRNMKSNKKAK